MGFDETYYLGAKLEQIRVSEPTHPAGVSVAALRAALAEAGFTPLTHYQTYGWKEKLAPNQFFNLQVGHGKNVIGEGYRSLLLSDVSPAYPFAKFTITHKRIQYVAMFNASQKIKSYDNPLLIGFQRKHGTFNFLNIILFLIYFFFIIIFQTFKVL